MAAWPEWKIRDFSEGMVDRVDNNLIPDNAAQTCRNFICRYVGKLQKRTGQIRLNLDSFTGPIHGLYAYYQGTARKLVVVSGSIVSAWDTSEISEEADFLSADFPSESEAPVFTDIKTGVDTDAVMLFETCANYMVGFNGVDAPFKWDGTTVSALANAPADGSLPILFKEKLFCVPVSSPSQLWWSESFDPEDWPAEYYWEIKQGDGDTISCLRIFLGELTIFKHRSIHSFRGTDISDFYRDEIDGCIGCVGPQAACVLGNRIYFVSEEGLFSFNGVSATPLHSTKIPKLWKSINKEALDRACVTSWDGLVWFSLPYGDSTVNNMVIIYDPDGGKFWPMDSVNASCFQSFHDGRELMLFSGDSVSGYVNRQDIGTDDFGLPISAYWIGKAFDQGQPEHQKKAKQAFIEDAPDQITPATLEMSLDYGDYHEWTYKNDDGLIREYRMPSAYTAKWRYITPKFSHNSLGSCEIRGLMIPVKTKDKPKGRTL